MPKAKRPYLAHDLETHDIHQTPETVIRVCRKTFGGEEVVDIRLWHLNKKSGEFYPRKFQGICLKTHALRDVIRVLKDKMNIDSNGTQMVS